MNVVAVKWLFLGGNVLFGLFMLVSFLSVVVSGYDERIYQATGEIVPLWSSDVKANALIGCIFFQSVLWLVLLRFGFAIQGFGIIFSPSRYSTFSKERFRNGWRRACFMKAPSCLPYIGSDLLWAGS